MFHRKPSFLALGTIAALAFGTLNMAHAHESGGSSSGYPCNPYYGRQMGPGMMGPGHGGQMMGPNMMGPGYGGQMMGPGMMGPGYRDQRMAPETMQPLRRDLTAEDVKHMMGHRLSWYGNPNLKLGEVEEKDEDTIVVDIVTQDGSLVRRWEVDRHTGWMQPAE